MDNIDWFRFEDKDWDFPFYKKNPPISKRGWIALFFALLIGTLLISDSIIVSLISCMILLLPVLYFLKWDYRAIFRMPKGKDVALAVVLFVGYMIYAIVMSVLLEPAGITSPGTIEESSVTVMSTLSLVFSMMSEEMIKFIPFMFFLRLFYKYTDKRKLSVIASVLIVMMFFASMHAYNLQMLIFAIFVQGFGSIFEFFGYIKTKNIWIPYITHMCTDAFIYITILLGL